MSNAQAQTRRAILSKMEQRLRGTENMFNVVRWGNPPAGVEFWSYGATHRMTWREARNLAAWIIAQDPDPELQEFLRLLSDVAT